MTDNEQQLIARFFADAAQQTIADDGFSHRVMRRLPSRVNWLARLWTAGCLTLGLVLFVVLRGWQPVGALLTAATRWITEGSVLHVNLLAVVVVYFLVLFYGIREVLNREQIGLV